jgi:hypothetical protein
MTITPHLIQTESPTDELALFLVGDKKAGKSHIAATAPGNILFLDFDQRLSALRTHPNVKNIYGLTFSDPTSTTTPPTAFNDLLGVLNQIERSPMLSNWWPQLGDKPIDTIVLDSIQTISDSARNYVLFNAGAQDGVSRNFAIGGRIYRVPKSYTAWGAEMEMVTSAVLQARAFLHCKHCWQSVTYDKGKMWHTDRAPKVPYDHEPSPKAMNVICTLHEAPEEDERSTPENVIFTGKITVYPARYHRLLVYFNEVWRVTRDNGRIPKVTCDPDGKFTQASTALGIEKITTPDIAQILNEAKAKRRPNVSVNTNTNNVTTQTQTQQGATTAQQTKQTTTTNTQSQPTNQNTKNGEKTNA